MEKQEARYEKTLAKVRDKFNDFAGQWALIKSKRDFQGPRGDPTRSIIYAWPVGPQCVGNL